MLVVWATACAGHRVEQLPSPVTYSIIVVNGVPVEGGGWPPTGGKARTQLYAWVGPEAAQRQFGWVAPEGVLCIVTDASLVASAPVNHWDLCLQPVAPGPK